MKDCNQCGKCCIRYGNGGLSASIDEIEYWAVFRPHIHKYVNSGNIWTDPETGQQLTRCPWLRQISNQNKYTCGIYYDRPDDCKYYPVNITQMIEDDCEMMETRDLASPKQAQNTLNRLMVDSRPPFKP